MPSSNTLLAGLKRANGWLMIAALALAFVVAPRSQRAGLVNLVAVVLVIVGGIGTVQDFRDSFAEFRASDAA